MLRLGLKLWSTDTQYLGAARALHARGVFDFLELMVPGASSLEDLPRWADVPWPIILHAPHSECGLNMAQAALESQNRAEIVRVAEACRVLRPERVIFHPGLEGALDETIRQIGVFRRACPEPFRLGVIENKPRRGLRGQTLCGAAPEEIRRVMTATGLGFCLDLPHAVAYANWAGQPWHAVVEEFLRLRPVMFHLADGDAQAEIDAHLHLGAGTLPLKEILARIPPGATVTLETDKRLPDRLDDFVDDIEYVRACLS